MAGINEEINELANELQIGTVTGNKYLIIGKNGELKLNTSALPPYFAGQLGYDPDSLTVTADTGINGVRVQIGQEEMWLVCNNSGAQIDNGKACYASGVDAVNNCLEVGLADNSSFATSGDVLGLATHDIPDGELGLVTERGIVRDFDTSALSPGLVWLGTSGNLTNTQPIYPDARIAMGVLIDSDLTAGKFAVAINRLGRAPINGAYSFTSTGILAGTYWKGGFYEWQTTSVELTLLNSVTIGTTDAAKAAHVGVVSGGVGVVVGGGQVGIQCTGILDSEQGPQTAAQTAVISDDITTLSLNDYMESVEKFSGVVTIDLYVVSGSPTSASFTFNRGFSKYDDFEDRDYTITGLEITWQGNATSSLDIALMKHTTTGWTYAASGFVAGNGDVCRKSVDQQLAGGVINNQNGAYKRLQLNEFIEGRGGLEGHIIQIVTGANSTIQTMDMRVDAVSEELDF
jgi:hypothetical protein